MYVARWGLLTLTQHASLHNKQDHRNLWRLIRLIYLEICMQKNSPTFPYRMMKPLDICYFAIYIFAITFMGFRNSYG